MPLSQVRAKTSKVQFSGQPKAEPPIWVSVLKELSTSHSSGSTISRAHRARKPWEKTFRTTPLAAAVAGPDGNLRHRPAGRREGGLLDGCAHRRRSAQNSMRSRRVARSVTTDRTSVSSSMTTPMAQA